MSNHERLRSIFDQPTLRWIVDRLVARMASGRSLRGKLVRANADASERRAVDDLLGRKSTEGAQLTLDLDYLENILHTAGLIETLEEVVLVCHGPVENRRAETERQEAAWQVVHDKARARCDGKPAMLEWINAMARDGTLKRLSCGDVVFADKLLESAFKVLDRNPTEEVLLANLSAHCAGDSHALDRGQPLATICLRAIASVYGIDGQRSAEARRKAWAAAGVIIDDLSAPVLVFNLRAAAGSALEQVLGLHRQQGHPAFLTYRQLQSGGIFEPLDPAMRVVFVCENPSIVSTAAREMGPSCPPLVCTNGQPTSSVRLLLSRLRQAGSQLRCHADFDWAGLRIIDQLVRDYSATPWCMNVEDYRNAAGTVSLDPQPFVSEWSPELADALRTEGKAVYEEQIIHSLLTQLGKESPLGAHEKRQLFKALEIHRK